MSMRDGLLIKSNITELVNNSGRNKNRRRRRGSSKEEENMKRRRRKPTVNRKTSRPPSSVLAKLDDPCTYFTSKSCLDKWFTASMELRRSFCAQI